MQSYSYTITSSASLLSDHLIGINRNADRHHVGTLIDSPGIRNSGQIRVTLLVTFRVRACPRFVICVARFLKLLLLTRLLTGGL